MRGRSRSDWLCSWRNPCRVGRLRRNVWSIRGRCCSLHSGGRGRRCWSRGRARPRRGRRRDRRNGSQGSLVLGDDPLDRRNQDILGFVVLLLVRVGTRHSALVGESQHAIHGGQDQALRVQPSHLGFERLDHVVLKVSERLHQARVEGLVRAQVLPAGLEHAEHDLLQALFFRNRGLCRQPEAAVDDRHGNGLSSLRSLRQLLRDRRLEVGHVSNELGRHGRLEGQRVAVHSRGLCWTSGRRGWHGRDRNPGQAVQRVWHVVGRKTLSRGALRKARLGGGS